MKKLFLVLALVLLPALAFAASATLTWDAPTSYTDGAPLNPATDLSGYVLGYGTVSRGSGSSYQNNVNVANPGTATVTYTLSSLTTGTWYFAIKAVSKDNIQSAWSNETSKHISGTPGAPTNLTVVSISAS